MLVRSGVDGVDWGAQAANKVKLTRSMDRMIVLTVLAPPRVRSLTVAAQRPRAQQPGGSGIGSPILALPGRKGSMASAAR